MHLTSFNTWHRFPTAILWSWWQVRVNRVYMLKRACFLVGSAHCSGTYFPKELRKTVNQLNYQANFEIYHFEIVFPWIPISLCLLLLTRLTFRALQYNRFLKTPPPLMCLDSSIFCFSPKSYTGTKFSVMPFPCTVAVCIGYSDGKPLRRWTQKIFW